MSAKCGTVAGYRVHRRQSELPCQPCRDAIAAWQREYVKRRYLTGRALVDGTGTRRRLQALVAVGWPQSHLAARLGIDAKNLSNLIHARRSDRVTDTTVRAVRDLYDLLWDSAPEGGPRVRAVRLAERYRWAVPLRWDDDEIDDPAARPSPETDRARPFDDIAVQQAMRGNNVHLRPRERAEAVRRLTALGLSAAEIAVRLRIEKRSVTRHRAASEKAA